MEAIRVMDTDTEETKPMRLIDGRLVVWHPLDSGPSVRQNEPAFVDVSCLPLPEAVRDDLDITRPMRLPVSPEDQPSTAR